MQIEPKSIRRRFITLIGVLLIALGWQVPARAVELSHYLPGLPNMDDYFLPPKEVGQFVYVQYNVYYHTETIRDRNGNEIKSITVNGPQGTPRTINLDVNVDQVFLVPTFLWAPKWDVLGGRYAAYVAVPVGQPSIESNLETERGRGTGASTSVWDIGDIFVQPLWFMWSFPREGRRPAIDVAAGYGFDAPTGRFHPGAADNVGLGFWEHQLQLPVRFTLDEATATSFVVANTVEVGQEKEKGVEVTPGAHYTLNWGFGRHFFDDWFEASLLGYHTFQITDDTGSGVSASSRGARDELHGIGTQIGIPKFGLAF